MAQLQLTDGINAICLSNAMKGVDAQIDGGDLVNSSAPRGCGKFTVPQMIADFETVTSGAIRSGERLRPSPLTAASDTALAPNLALLTLRRDKNVEGVAESAALARKGQPCQSPM